MSNPLYDRIRTRLAEMGMAGRSDRAVSLEMGLPSGALREISRGRKPADPARLAIIAAYLGWTMEQLVGKAPPGEKPALILARTASLPPIGELPADVPVYGVVAGSQSGSFQLESGIVDYVRRAPGIAHSRDVYALFVVGESMSPRFKPGELVYVSPTRPPKIGDDVIVCVRPKVQGDPDHCFIKCLVRRRPDSIEVMQHNPEKRMSYPVDQVTRMHKVLTIAEVLGI